MFPWAKVLFSAIVDYAGLFPPAKLDLQPVMVNYNRYCVAEHHWMLGNLVVPISRWEEFESLLSMMPSETGQTQSWYLSLIIDQSPESAIAHIKSLNQSKQTVIRALEFPIFTPREIEALIPLLPTDINTYFEIPFNKDLEKYLSVLQNTKASVKIRTGGLKPEAFPSVEQLAQFIWDCSKAKIAFKATAGLHHLLAGQYPLTKTPDSLLAQMYGFLNLAIASAFVYGQKLTFSELLTLLQESSLDNFQFNTKGVYWCEHQLNFSELENVRKHFFHSFGSCSFEEPVDEIINLFCEKKAMTFGKK